MKKLVSIVLPAHNESGNVGVIKNRIQECFPFESYDLELIFVNDGSTDDTMEQLYKLSQEDKSVFYIELSRNFGHQCALKAGLDYAHGDCVISMDCDMQHPPELIKPLIEKWEQGYDIVYTCRAESETASYMKRKTSNAFYHIFNSFSDVQIEKGTADFRLMSRNVADVFKRFRENDLFIRGMIKWMGFRQAHIDYEPNERFSGTTKYTVRKMLRLAVHAVTSFSVRPLYLAIYIGFGLSLLALLYLPYVLYSFFYSGHYAYGWGSVILTIVFFSGLQLCVLGVIGLYLGKLFIQVKDRPLYIVRSSNFDNVPA
ncbi:glycosyltransferase family 2 protein [Paludibacter sp.]|uniref:glycosyltransferase family 2 protein n=1 Tax=Paludibacter sp. TaxID=1898105 RepID=UPI00135575F6|nr:glycosyltransferase family 2 protein [Paludibacter sp.]MTK52741.1 glycosyltransferase family 2 protein [Paludibacter sp.]